MSEENNKRLDLRINPLDWEDLEAIKKQCPETWRVRVKGDLPAKTIADRIRLIGHELELLNYELSSFDLRVGEGEKILDEAERICKAFIEEWKTFKPFS
jgi:hypothetical protein